MTELYGARTFELLEEIGSTITEFYPGFDYYHLDEETVNPWKIFYLYADSLFGYDSLTYDIENELGLLKTDFPTDAIVTYNRGVISNLCEDIFVNENGLWDKIGKGAICTYNLERSCDQKVID